MKQRTFFLVTYLGVTFVLGLIVFYYLPPLLISTLTEIPSEFLTGVLTFDGIMIGVSVLPATVTSPLREKSDPRSLSFGLAAFFIISAVFTLYALLRLHIGQFGETAAYVGDSGKWSIGFMGLGLTIWFLVNFGIAYLFPERQETATP